MSRLVEGPIDAAALTSSLCDDRHGAVVSFTGTVRNHHGGRRVRALSYTAYREMAEQGMAEVLAEAGKRWDVRVDARHRLGDLVPGDPAVVVVAAAAHRGPAFEAAAWVIDEIKRRVPIWKHETYLEGDSSWIGG